jgi:hypothetical protein
MSLDNIIIARQGEIDVDLDVVLNDSATITLATGAYCFLDFWLPDGTIVYKGDYNGGSGLITVVMGLADDLLEKDGFLYIQFVICDTDDRDTATEVWKSKKIQAIVATSVMAYDAASNEIVPDLEMPNTYKAEDTSIVDVAELFTATDVEGALAELMTKICGAVTVLTGDAENANVLINKTFYKDNAALKKTGTMPNNAGDNAALSDIVSSNKIYLVAPEGYYDGVDDTVYSDIGYELVTLEDHDAMFSELFITIGSAPSLIKLRLSDLGFLAKQTAYNDNGVSRELLYSNYQGILRLFSARYNYNIRWQRAEADFSDHWENGGVSYGAYGYCIDQTTMDDQFIYIGQGDGKIYKVDKNDITSNSAGGAGDTDYGGVIYAVCCFGDDVNGWFVFIGGATTQKVFKYNDSMVKQTESADYGGTINALCQDGTHLFGGGATTRKVFKYLPADLSKLAESSDLGSEITALTCDDTYVYAALSDGFIFKLLKSDLTTVDSEDCYTGRINVIKEYRSYLYIGGDTTKKVYKIRKSDLAITEESATQANTIYGIAFGSVLET